MAKTPKKLTLKVKPLAHHDGLSLPAYQSAGAAGLDLVAAVPKRKPLRLRPGAHALVPTGLSFEIPKGYEIQVRPRSGLAAKHGVTVLNTPGTIDSDYRGEVQVILINLGAKPFVVERGDRIAQMVIAPIVQADIKLVTQLSATKRGVGGFGSTGAKSAKKKPKPRAKKTAAAKKSAISKKPVRKVAARRRQKRSQS